MPAVPSPKAQANVSASRSGSEESEPSNAIATPVATEYGPPALATRGVLLGTGFVPGTATSPTADPRAPTPRVPRPTLPASPTAPHGRTPWPETGCAWVVGGGVKTGQISGAADGRGERVIGNPIRMQNVLATLYPILGIDPATTLPDYNGRPQYLLENREPVAGLV